MDAKFDVINPSTGRYFPLKYTCLKNFFINHSHTVLLLQYVAKRWENIFGDVALSVIGLGGAKTEVKGGMASRLGIFIEKHRGRNGQFFLSILGSLYCKETELYYRMPLYGANRMFTAIWQ